MAYLMENLLTNPNQYLNAHHFLAAFGAGALFLMEGALLGILVFAGAKTTGKSHAPRIPHP